MFGWWKSWKRNQLAEKPFPKEWFSHLEKRVPFYEKMPEKLRENFLTALKIFAWEKNFEGANGMEITDEVKVVISAVAVRLVLFLDLSHYDRIESVIVYPSHFRTPETEDAVVYGVAHSLGSIVLSWESVLHGLKNPEDGQDTTTHEFAHALDLSDGTFNGTPELREGGDFQEWSEVMSHHFLRLQKRKRPERKVMDMYGATNESEFFAVATESFFEKPEQMKRHTPELYDAMKKFYGWDPVALE